MNGNWNVEIDRKYRKEAEELERRHLDKYREMLDFLTSNPDTEVRGKVFRLKGKKYRGAREYKELLNEGTLRIYYLLIPEDHRVVIYYLGSKPKRVPPPP